MFSSGLRKTDIEQVLGEPSPACIPNNYGLVREAIDRGVPLDEIKPGNKITQQLKKLMLPQPAAKGGRRAARPQEVQAVAGRAEYEPRSSVEDHGSRNENGSVVSPLVAPPAPEPVPAVDEPSPAIEGVCVDACFRKPSAEPVAAGRPIRC